MKRIHVISLVLVTFILDQWTKIWAVARLGDANGNPSGESIEVLGTYFRFTLAYNYGSAFSIKPWKLVPIITPTVFYTILTAVAFFFLVRFYKSLHQKDWMSQTGILLILSGALGNLMDRFRLGKVVDFLDSEFPDISIGSYYMQRWPTFNLADSWVLIGIACILLSPILYKELHPQEKKEAKVDEQ